MFLLILIYFIRIPYLITYVIFWVVKTKDFLLNPRRIKALTPEYELWGESGIAWSNEPYSIQECCDIPEVYKS